MTTVALSADRTDAAVRVLANAFVTNPLHVAVFGPHNVQANEAFFRVGLRTMAGEKRLVVDDGQVLGVVHWVASSKCQVTPVQKLTASVALMRGCGVRSALKVAHWLSVWARHDPREAHVHFGPIAVAPDAQGRGIGGQLMTAFCQRLDESAAVGYLETDRPENVRFYGKYGFEVVGTAPIYGVTNYFMRRARSR